MSSQPSPESDKPCYFAHHITDYDTPREEEALKQLEAAGFNNVFNPNSPESQEGYRKHGMEYFLGIVATSSALAFQRFPNNAIGAGVAKEIAEATQLGLDIYEITDSGVRQTDGKKAVEESLSVEETRALIRHLKSSS